MFKCSSYFDIFFMIFISCSRKPLRYYFKSSHDHLIPHSFQVSPKAGTSHLRTLSCPWSPFCLPLFFIMVGWLLVLLVRGDTVVVVRRWWGTGRLGIRRSGAEFSPNFGVPSRVLVVQTLVGNGREGATLLTWRWVHCGIRGRFTGGGMMYFHGVLT